MKHEKTKVKRGSLRCYKENQLLDQKELDEDNTGDDKMHKHKFSRQFEAQRQQDKVKFLKIDQEIYEKDGFFLYYFGSTLGLQCFARWFFERLESNMNYIHIIGNSGHVEKVSSFDIGVAIIHLSYPFAFLLLAILAAHHSDDENDLEKMEKMIEENLEEEFKQYIKPNFSILDENDGDKKVEDVTFEKLFGPLLQKVEYEKKNEQQEERQSRAKLLKSIYTSFPELLDFVPISDAKQIVNLADFVKERKESIQNTVDWKHLTTQLQLCQQNRHLLVDRKNNDNNNNNNNAQKNQHYLDLLHQQQISSFDKSRSTAAKIELIALTFQLILFCVVCCRNWVQLAVLNTGLLLVAPGLLYSFALTILSIGFIWVLPFCLELFLRAAWIDLKQFFGGLWNLVLTFRRAAANNNNMNNNNNNSTSFFSSNEDEKAQEIIWKEFSAAKISQIVFEETRKLKVESSSQQHLELGKILENVFGKKKELKK